MGAYNVISPSAMAAGQPEDISVVLANFQAIATVLNGGIDNSNIAVAAAITASKLAGFPADSSKILLGDGSWGTLVTGPGAPVTALPGSPTDKQQAVWTDSVTVPTYTWLMQYNASLGYWQNIGGHGWLEGTTTITIPRAGDYVCEIGASGLGSGAGSAWTAYILSVTAGGITLNAYAGQGGGQNNNDYSSCIDRGKMVGLTTSQVLTLSDTSSNGSGSITATRRYIRAQAVKIV